MIESIEWLRAFIVLHPFWEYVIVFFGVAFGGEVVIFTLAFLMAQNVISVLPFILFSFLGTFFSNTLWFVLGKTALITKIISHRYTHPTVSTIVEAITKASKENRFMALTIIKFILGTAFILIAYTNKTQLKWREFVLGESVAIFISLLVVIPIGFFSGLGFNYLANAFNNLYIAIGFIALVLVSLAMFRIWFKKFFTVEI